MKERVRLEDAVRALRAHPGDDRDADATEQRIARTLARRGQHRRLAARVAAGVVLCLPLAATTYAAVNGVPLELRRWFATQASAPAHPRADARAPRPSTERVRTSEAAPLHPSATNADAPAMQAGHEREAGVPPDLSASGSQLVAPASEGVPAPPAALGDAPPVALSRRRLGLHGRDAGPALGGDVAVLPLSGVAGAAGLASEAASLPAPDRYARAHHVHFVIGDPERALEAWDDYLAAEPAGTFAPEARYNRALCLVRLGRRHAAIDALRPFADGERHSYRRAEARALIEALEAR